MVESEGRNLAITLRNGEIVGLVKPPGEFWRISYFEFSHRVRFDFQVGGMVLEWLQGVPQDWRDQVFDSAEKAAAFVQREIDAGRVSGSAATGDSS